MTIPTPTLVHPRQLRMRLRDVSLGQWRLLGEALVMLTTSSLAIAILPFRQVVRIAAWGPERPANLPFAAFEISDACWAIEAVAWRMPWRTVCFQKGLTLHLMLRRRGITSILHYGVGKIKGDKLGAHVWISIDDRIVMGGEAAGQFRCLARYPENGA